MVNLNEVVVTESDKPKINGNGTGEKPINEDQDKKEKINS